MQVSISTLAANQIGENGMIDKYDEIAFCLCLFVPCALVMIIFFIILLKDEVSDIFSDVKDKLDMVLENVISKIIRRKINK